MLIGDFGEHSLKAMWGHGAEFSITCSLQELKEKLCRDNGFLGLNLRALSCIDGWCLPSHANSVLWPTLNFAHRASLLEPIPQGSSWRALLRCCMAVALYSHSHAVLQLFLWLPTTLQNPGSLERGRMTFHSSKTCHGQ